MPGDQLPALAQCNTRDTPTFDVEVGLAAVTVLVVRAVTVVFAPEPATMNL